MLIHNSSILNIADSFYVFSIFRICRKECIGIRIKCNKHCIALILECYQFLKRLFFLNKGDKLPTHSFYTLDIINEFL